MLTLTRREGQWIELIVGGKTIARVQVVRVRGKDARLRFDAPPEVRISRGEDDDAEENQHGTEQGKRVGFSRQREGTLCTQDCKGDCDDGSKCGSRRLPDQSCGDAAPAGDHGADR